VLPSTETRDNPRQQALSAATINKDCQQHRQQRLSTTRSTTFSTNTYDKHINDEVFMQWQRVYSSQLVLILHHYKVHYRCYHKARLPVHHKVQLSVAMRLDFKLTIGVFNLGVNMDFTMEISMKLNRVRCYKAQFWTPHQTHHEFLSFSTYRQRSDVAHIKPR